MVCLINNRQKTMNFKTYLQILLRHLAMDRVQPGAGLQALHSNEPKNLQLMQL